MCESSFCGCNGYCKDADSYGIDRKGIRYPIFEGSSSIQLEKVESDEVGKIVECDKCHKDTISIKRFSNNEHDIIKYSCRFKEYVGKENNKVLCEECFIKYLRIFFFDTYIKYCNIEILKPHEIRPEIIEYNKIRTSCPMCKLKQIIFTPYKDSKNKKYLESRRWWMFSLNGATCNNCLNHFKLLVKTNFEGKTIEELKEFLYLNNLIKTRRIRSKPKIEAIYTDCFIREINNKYPNLLS